MPRLRLNRYQQRQPIGGHHLTTGGIAFKGDTAEEVVDKVTNYRLINGIPIGSPIEELLEFYAARFPWMVEKELDNPAEYNESSKYVRWRESISKAWGNPVPKMVGEVIASTRWEICEKCPFNVKKDWPDTEESKEFERKLLMLNKTAKIPKNQNFCSLHGHDLAFLSFIETPEPLSRKTKDKPNYEGCWIG